MANGLMKLYRVGVAPFGHELRRHAWRRRPGQCGQHLCQHAKCYWSARLQPQREFGQDHSKCVSPKAMESTYVDLNFFAESRDRTCSPDWVSLGFFENQ